MENLTHTLVGLMLARVGLEKSTMRGAGMMMLAANAPDIDAVTWFSNTTVYLEYHRGFTHTLAFMPVMALLPMLLVRAKFSLRTWLASMAAVLSHLLLDWTNAYGIPLLMPLSQRRWRLDIVNIVDIWAWAILLGAVTATLLVTLVSKEMGSRDAGGPRRTWAWAALVLLISYELLRFFLHARAVGVMEARLYDGDPPARVTALPGAIDPWRWRGVIETRNGENGFVTIVPVDLREPFNASSGRRYPVLAHTTEMDRALETKPFRVFSNFAQLPYWQYSKTEDGMALALMDLRFGDPGNLGFGGVRALVDASGKVTPR